MGNKRHGTRHMSFVTHINDPVWLGSEAKRMSNELLTREFRGPGDTIEAAAFRLQTKHAVDASIILQGRQREPRDWLVSRWMSLFRAHCEVFGSRASQAYEDKRDEVDMDRHPVLVRLADFVAGRPAEKEGEEVKGASTP